MADERRTKAVLEYEARVDRAIQNIERLIHRVGDIRQTLGIVNQSAAKTGDELRNTFDGAEKSASKLSQRLDEIAKKRLRGTLPSQAGSINDLRGSLTGGAGNAGGSALGALGPGISALKGLQQGDIGQTIGGVIRLKQELPQLAQGLSQLPGILGSVAQQGASVAAPLGATAASIGAVVAVAAPAAVLIGAVAIGLKLAGDAAKESKQNFDAALSTQQRYYQQVETLTTQQAQTELKLLERRRVIQQQATDETERALKNLEQQTGISRNVGIAAPGQLGDGFRQLTAQLDENKKAASETDASIGRLTGGLQSNAFAANEAAFAEQKLADARVKGFQEDLERKRQFTEGISQEDKDARQKSLQDQIDFNKRWLEKNAERIAGDETLAAIFDEVDKETAKLTKDLAELKAVTASNFARDDLSIDGDDLQRGNELQGELVDTRARELELIEKGAAALNDFADEMDRVAEDRGVRDKREQQDFSAKRLQDQLTFTRRQAETDAAHYKDRAKKIADFNADLGEDEGKALAARAKEVEALNLEQIRAAEDFARTIRGIQDSIGDAAANLDAVGVRAAKRQLRDATEQYETERRRRDQDADRKLDEMAENAEVEKAQRVAAFQDQLADEDARYEEERRRDQDAFHIQQQQEDDARRVRLERQREDDTRQDERRRQSFDKQIQTLQKQLLEPEEKLKYESGVRQRKILSDMLRGVESDLAATKARVAGSTADLANSVASAAASNASRSSAMTTTATVYNRGISTGGSNASLGGGADSFARRFGNGGSFGAGELGVVGDRTGPELVQFGMAGRVFSPDQTRQMLGGKTFQNYGDVYLNGNLAPAELEAQVENFMAAAFDRLAEGEQ